MRPPDNWHILGYLWRADLALELTWETEPEALSNQCALIAKPDEVRKLPVNENLEDDEIGADGNI